MPGLSKLLAVFVLAAAVTSAAIGAQQPPPGQPPAGGRRGGFPRPQREASRTVADGTASITGRVLAADTGRPVKRARVTIAGGGRPRAVTSDEQGRYMVPALPAGTYTITATKTGFVDGAFGQRRAQRSGTPVELKDGQQFTGADLRLSRGGVITGRIVDEDGEPLARASVSVLRHQYVRGEKQLTTAGADQSDDRGQFRVFGLPPGDYYVSATVGGIERALRQILDPGGGAVDQAPESTGYAPTYYPGVVTASDAARVKVAAAQEATGIDFQLQIVPLATVRGTVVGGAGLVMLIPEDGASGVGRGGGAGRGGGIGGLLGGQGLRAATKQDGTFSIANVTPGNYTIVARVDGGPDAPGGKTAMQSLVVAGEEVNVALTPAPGVQVSGSVTLEAAGAEPPKGFAGFRVQAQPADSIVALPRMARPADVTEKGQFSVADVMAGRYMIRGTAPRGWTMKAVFLDGRDVTDQLVDIRSHVSGLTVIFTDRISGLAGTVRDRRGNPAAGLTVVAFSSDETLWRPQSRHIVTARTDQTGAYKITVLPPGDYFVVAVEDVEQGEWFDPAFLEVVKENATKVAVGVGEQLAQDLKAPPAASPELLSASSTR